MTSLATASKVADEAAKVHSEKGKVTSSLAQGDAQLHDTRAFLAKQAEQLQMQLVTLQFRSAGLEEEYLLQMAKQRRPVLVTVFIFDLTCYLVRGLVRGWRQPPGFLAAAGSLGPQLLNMLALYFLVALVNRHSTRLGSTAARQEEWLLSGAMSLAVCTLLLSLTPSHAQDYVFAGFFVICTVSFLKLRWLVGSLAFLAPLVAILLPKVQRIVPDEAFVQLLVAWAVGTMMSYLADSYRRQMFANERLATAAAAKELAEAGERITAQRELAAVQAQAASRAISVAHERAANEAKSEFMSLMCHEVRTPLNGCLASAEMLLETDLQDEQRDLAKTIRVSGSILLSTVSNFLDFFKMEAGKALDVVRTEVDLQEMATDVHCIVEAMVGRTSDISLLLPFVDNVPQWVIGDPDRLRGILLNLYTNAAKFTRRGALALHISVTGPNYKPLPHQHDSLPWAAVQDNNSEASESSSASKRRTFFMSAACKGGSGQQQAGTGRAQHAEHSSGAKEKPGAPSSPSATDAKTASSNLRSQWSAQSDHENLRASGIPVHEKLAPVEEADSVCEAPSVIDTQSQSASLPASSVRESLELPPTIPETISLAEPAAGAKLRLATQPVPEPAATTAFHSAQSVLSPEASSPSMLKDSAEQLAAKVPMAAQEQMPVAATAQALSDPPLSQETASTGLSDSSTQQGHLAPNSVAALLSSPLVTKAAQQAQEAAAAAPPSPPSSHSRAVAEGPVRLCELRASPAGPVPKLNAEDAFSQPSSRGDSFETQADQKAAHARLPGPGTWSPFAQQAVKSPRRSLERSEARMAARQAAAPAGHEAGGGGPRINMSPCNSDEQELPDGEVDPDGGQTGFYSVETWTSSNGTPTGTGTGTAPGSSSRDTDSVRSQKRVPFFRSGKRDSSWMEATSALDGWHSVVSCSLQPPQGGGLAEQWLVFEVADTGCGIAPESLHSLFRDFVQGTDDEMQRPRTRGGTGLGLSICSKQVSVLGGQIGAISKVGAGSTFWFTIPLLLPDNAAAAQGQLRRVGSWGTVNSFSDGHSSHRDSSWKQDGKSKDFPVPSQPSNYRKFYRAARSGEPQVRKQKIKEDQDLPGAAPGPGNAANQTRQHSAPESVSDAMMEKLTNGRHSADGTHLPSKAAEAWRNELAATVVDALPARIRNSPAARFAAAQALLCGVAYPTGSKSSVADASTARASLDIRESLVKEHWSSRGSHARDTSPLRATSSQGSPPKTVTSAPSQNSTSTAAQAPKYFQNYRSVEPLPAMVRKDQATAGQGRKQQGAGAGKSWGQSSQRAPAHRPSIEARWRQLDLSALKAKRVLLAEDNLINQAVARKMLTSLGMTCEVASNGADAVQAVVSRSPQAQDAFNIILMDMSMPVMGGVEATRVIRRAGILVPIVAMTANAADRDRDECLAAGMDGFLSKPVLRDRLADAMLRALSGRQRYHETDTLQLPYSEARGSARNTPTRSPSLS